jgi:hypothetical protein
MERAVLIFTLKPGKDEEAERVNQEFESPLQAANTEISGLEGWDKFVLKGRYVDVIDYRGCLDAILGEAQQNEAHQQFLVRLHPLIEETKEEVADCFMRRVFHFSASEHR